MTKEFTMSEMRAIRNCKDKSSLGPDQIEYRMIKCLPNRIKEELLKRYNYAFRESVLFKEWKNNQTIFIEKKNKKK